MPAGYVQNPMTGKPMPDRAFITPAKQADIDARNRAITNQQANQTALEVQRRANYALRVMNAGNTVKGKQLDAFLKEANLKTPSSALIGRMNALMDEMKVPSMEDLPGMGQLSGIGDMRKLSRETDDNELPPQAKPSAKTAQGGYKIGGMYPGGLKYIGGDPNDESSWEKVGQ